MNKTLPVIVSALLMVTWFVFALAISISVEGRADESLDYRGATEQLLVAGGDPSRADGTASQGDQPMTRDLLTFLHSHGASVVYDRGSSEVVTLEDPQRRFALDARHPGLRPADGSVLVSEQARGFDAEALVGSRPSGEPPTIRYFSPTSSFYGSAPVVVLTPEQQEFGPGSYTFSDLSASAQDELRQLFARHGYQIMTYVAQRPASVAGVLLDNVSKSFGVAMFAFTLMTTLAYVLGVGAGVAARARRAAVAAVMGARRRALFGIATRPAAASSALGFGCGAGACLLLFWGLTRFWVLPQMFALQSVLAAFIFSCTTGALAIICSGALGVRRVRQRVIC